MDGWTVPWNFSRYNWGEIAWILVPIFFAMLFGVLLAFVGGALVIHLIFEALTSYAAL